MKSMICIDLCQKRQSITAISSSKPPGCFHVLVPRGRLLPFPQEASASQLSQAGLNCFGGLLRYIHFLAQPCPNMPKPQKDFQDLTSNLKNNYNMLQSVFTMGSSQIPSNISRNPVR
jgi:hypothetical protein